MAILLFLIIPTRPQTNGDENPSNKKYFELDVVKMDDYLRQTAIITLLKAGGKLSFFECFEKWNIIIK